MSVMPAEVYYPYQIGVVMPRGEMVYEVVIVADEKQGMFVKLLEVMSRHYVNLYGTFTRTDLVSDTFIAHVIGDFKKADASAHDIQEELSKLPLVRSVKMEKKDSMPFGRFLFPVMIASEIRASVLPVDALVEWESRLLDEGAKKNVIELSRPLGLSLYTSFRRYLPWADKTIFVSAAEDALRALGWGIFKLDFAGKRNEKVRVTVRQPIFSEQEGVKQSYTVVGMTAGLLEGITGMRLELQGEPTYSAVTKEMKFELVCKFPASGRSP